MFNFFVWYFILKRCYNRFLNRCCKLSLWILCPYNLLPVPRPRWSSNRQFLFLGKTYHLRTEVGIMQHQKKFWRFTLCNQYLKIGFQRWKIHFIDFMSSGFQYISTDWGRCAVIKWRDPPDWKMTQIWTLWCTCQGDLEGGCVWKYMWVFSWG